jgi:hypothetical protein
MYHNNVTDLIHFHFHNHFIVSESSTCFGRQASIFRRHYTSGFWYELRALEAVGWLQPASRLRYCDTVYVKPLTPELNRSALRCLTRFFTWKFASVTVHFVNICVKTQKMQQLF